MKQKDLAVQQALLRAKTFFAAHAAELGSATGAPTINRLDEVVRAMGDAGTTQLSSGGGARSATQSKGELRDVLRTQFLRPISRFATANLTGADMKGLASFDVPVGSISDLGLINTARAMAKLAAEHSQLFRAEQLPEDFLQRLNTTVDALERVIMGRDANLMTRRRATTAAGSQVTRARRVIRALTGLVEARVGSNAALLAEWRFAVRIPQKPGVPRGTVRAPDERAAGGTAEGGALIAA